MATWANLVFQDSNSPLMEQLTFFLGHSLLILVMITTLVGHLMALMLFNPSINHLLLQGQTIEVIWTILPAIISIFIALPSLCLLYMFGSVTKPCPYS